MSKGYILTPSGPMPVKQLYTLTGGTAFPVDKAYTLTSGTARLWYQRGTPLGNSAVGSTVKIAVGGTEYDWLVVHQGLPGSMYDASCSGTWLLMKDIYTDRKWHSSARSNDYSGSSVHSYLNDTFLHLLESGAQNTIKQVKIPYRKGNNPGNIFGGANTTVASGANGLSTKVFLLSMAETSFSVEYMPKSEGAELSYFKGCADNGASSKRVAKLKGSAHDWWLRSPYCNPVGFSVYFVNTSGDGVIADSDWSCGVRPCMILPKDVLVDDTGHIIGANDPRTPLGWYSVGSTIKMDINGNKRVWRIAYKGNPNPNLYDESCNGVWLVLNTIYSTRANGSDCQYAGGAIDTYLNGTFLDRIDKDGNAAKYIKEVKIPYAKKQGDGSWEVQTKENGLPCKVFLPSIFELGGAENLSIYKDGSKLGYYDGSPSTLTLKQSGTPAPWRTRTVTSDAQSEFSIDANGTITTCSPTDVIGVVPCVIMNPDALVENGIIIGE